MNSAIGSHDFSSTWANNLPRFVNRRYALTGCATSSSHGAGPRKNSVDSEISFSVRHVSVESRRNSIDSQVSVKIAEMKTKVASRSRNGSKSKSRQHSRHHRRDFTSRRYSRKESSTSVESQTVTSIQKGRRSTSSRTTGGLLVQIPPNKRRSGISALDPGQINELIAKNKILLPFLTTSEDENQSLGSFNVQDSKLDVILKQIGLSEHKIIENKLKHESMENIEIFDHEEIEMDNLGEEAVGGRTSKNSVRSVNSKKSSKPGSQRMKRTKKNSKNSRPISKTANTLAITNSAHRVSDRAKIKKREEKKREKEREKENVNDSSFTSFNSDLAHFNNVNLVQSSYSGISLANSRNSKRSVDVGIQTNSHEIATQTLSSFEFKDKILKNEENEDIYTENHKLLPGKTVNTTNGKLTQTPRRRNTNEMCLTESEKLKMLLLPSK